MSIIQSQGVASIQLGKKKKERKTKRAGLGFEPECPGTALWHKPPCYHAQARQGRLSKQVKLHCWCKRFCQAKMKKGGGVSPGNRSLHLAGTTTRCQPLRYATATDREEEASLKNNLPATKHLADDRTRGRWLRLPRPPMPYHVGQIEYLARFLRTRGDALSQFDKYFLF